MKGENEYCAPTAPGGVCCSPMTCQMKKGKGKCQKCVTEGNTCKDSWELCCDGLACSSDKKKCVQAGPAPPAAAAAPRKTCSVSLQQQLSKKACTLGKSFDCNDDGTLFVKNGCRGIFYCDGVGGIKCEDQTLQSKATCACTLPELEVTAVHNPDDSVAVVVMNPSDVARRTAIYDKASGRRAPIEVPAHAIHTYWYSKE